MTPEKIAKQTALLEALAQALTACGEAGMCIKLKHGIVYSRNGYVLPLDDGKWTARNLTYDALSPADDDPEEG